ASDRDLQRDALRDLVQLAAESAAREIEIERVHKTQLQQSEKQLAKTLEDIDPRHESRKQQIEEEHASRMAQVAQQHEAAVADLNNFDKTSRTRIEYDHDRIHQDLRSKLQSAVWLAESVFEATQNQIAKEYKKAKEDHGNRMEELSELMKKSSAL